jgi:hypothetical protein
VAPQFRLVEGDGLFQEISWRGGRQTQFMFQMNDSFAEGEAEVELGEADQIATASAPVAIEEILGSIHIEGRILLRV